MGAYEQRLSVPRTPREAHAVPENQRRVEAPAEPTDAALIERHVEGARRSPAGRAKGLDAHVDRPNLVAADVQGTGDTAGPTPDVEDAPVLPQREELRDALRLPFNHFGRDGG